MRSGDRLINFQAFCLLRSSSRPSASDALLFRLASTPLIHASLPKLSSCLGRNTLHLRRQAVHHLCELSPERQRKNHPSKMSYGFGGDAPPAVREYDDILHSQSLQTYFNLSREIGGEVQTQANTVQQLFNAERDFLMNAANHKKPADNTLRGMLEPIAARIQAAQDIREKNRASKLFTHLSAVSESIPALGWIAVSPTPAPYIKEMIDAGLFYSNRILKEYKDKDPKQCDWARAWIDTLQQLQVFVKKTHTTGVVWNPRGGDLTGGPQGSTSALSNSAPGGRGPAPPPPGPPPPMDPQFFKCNFPPQQPSAADDKRHALFQEINKGDAITGHLKKVTADMQTHKNTTLRAGSQVSEVGAKAAGQAGYGGQKPGVGTGPAKIELTGKKWDVSNQKSNQKIVIDQTEMNHSIYIFRCSDSVVQVKGKVSSITVDSCSKVSVVCDTLVSFAEIVNSQRTQIQVMGKVPTIQIDKSDGVQIYLSKDSLDCEVFSAKSSEMNISVPQADGEFLEHPVPEQFRTKWDPKKKKLVTDVTEATG